ncbi:MAG: sialidase family protein [Bacteroidota bacterium]|nr:sialidase family protein [Bacteroidota bacterium]
MVRRSGAATGLFPGEELRETVIALDSASRPWVLTGVHRYRPVLRNGDWEFVSERHGLDIRPAFLAVAPWGCFYTARTGGGMLCSTDSGATWTEEGPAGSEPLAGCHFLDGARVLVFDASRLYLGSDSGRSWMSLPSPPGMTEITAVWTDAEGIVLAGLRGGSVFVSSTTDLGFSWQESSDGLSGVLRIRDILRQNGSVLCIAEHAMEILCMQRDAKENTWRSASILYPGASKLVQGEGSTVYHVSPDEFWEGGTDGSGWMVRIGLLSASQWSTWTGFGNDVFLCHHSEEDAGFYRSTDAGEHWRRAYPTLSADDPIRHAKDPAGDHLVVLASDSVYHTSDTGLTWEAQPMLGWQFSTKRPVYTAGHDLYLVSDRSDLLIRTTDHGATWTELHRSMPGVENGMNSSVYLRGSRLYLFTGQALIVSDDRGMTWQQTSCVPPVPTPKFFAVADDNIQFVAGADLSWRSSDGGRTWTALYGVGEMTEFIVAPDGHELFALFMTSRERIHRSTDGGEHWEDVSPRPVSDIYGPWMVDMDLTPDGRLLLSTGRGHFVSRASVVTHSAAPPALESFSLEAWPQPLPAGSRLHLRLQQDANHDLHLRLSDLLGRQLLSFDAERFFFGGVGTIPTDALAPGVYQLRVERSSRVVAARCIIVR